MLLQQLSSVKEIDDRDVFVALVHRYGRNLALPRKFLPQTKISDDDQTDCWTHAWEYAKKHSCEYWEGSCALGSAIVKAHAWCVHRGKTIELTEGYKEARFYRGIRIKTGITGEMTAKWTGPRSSVLEALIGAGTLTTPMFLQITYR